MVVLRKYKSVISCRVLSRALVTGWLMKCYIKLVSFILHHPSTLLWGKKEQVSCDSASEFA